MSDIKVGQVAAIRRRGEHVFGYTVTKVTPTGQVTITGPHGGTRSFNKNGREIGGSTYSWVTLVTGDAAIKEAKREEARCTANNKVAMLIRACTPPSFSSNADTAELQLIISDLDVKLNAAKLALVEAKALDTDIST